MRLLNVLLPALFVCLIFKISLNAETLKLTGNFIQGGLAFGQVLPGSKVKINGHTIRVSPEGKFIIGFGRDYPETSVLTVYLKNGSKEIHELKILQRVYKIQRIEGLPDSQVNPDEKALVRIKQESEAIKKARSVNRDQYEVDSGFIWPAKGTITGIYGSQRILNGEPRQPHYGIDLAAPVGTPVVAPASGVVSYSQDMYFSGKTLVLDHGHRLSSSFLHLDKILVQVGDRVQQGEKIALVGATGRVTGAHLDWRMNWYGQRIDPGLLMGEQPTIKNQ